MAHGSDRNERWQRVVEEHRELQRHLTLLTDWAVAAPRPSDWGPELARRATAVLEDATDHFAGEAEETLFRELEAKTPHLIHELGVLRQEHGTIVLELREVIRQAPEASGSAADRLAARVRAVVALMNRHEARETELVFRSVYDEMGTGD